MNSTKLLLLAIALLAIHPARASLLGAEVSCQFLPSECDPASAIVSDGPDAEFTLFTTLSTGARRDLFEVDVMASEIEIMALSDFGITAGISLFFDDLFWTNDPTGVLTGVSLITSNPNLGSNNVSFTEHSVRLTHLALTSYTSGEIVRLQLETDHGGDIGLVPVPATVWLFGTSLIGLFGLRKRRETV